jgi:uncharacterized RDD family membrane protein YckC
MTALEPTIGVIVPSPPLAPRRYAGLATRVLAFAVDVMVVNVVGWFVAVIIALGVSFIGVPDEVAAVLVAIGSLIALLWSIGYFAFFWSTTGQTLGNRILGIRVIDARTLQPPPPRRAVRRFFCLILAALPFCLGFLWILVDDRRRGWHDKLARTVVADVTDEPAPIRSDVRPHRRR